MQPYLVPEFRRELLRGLPDFVRQSAEKVKANHDNTNNNRA